MRFPAPVPPAAGAGRKRRDNAGPGVLKGRIGPPRRVGRPTRAFPPGPEALPVPKFSRPRSPAGPEVPPDPEKMTASRSQPLFSASDPAAAVPPAGEMPAGAGAGLHTAAGLVGAGLAPASALPALERVAARYAVSVTPDMADLIDTADPADPVARQFVPTAAELVMRPEERADPIGDDAHSPVEGIVHRYPDRVLLKLLHVCPVYCRFCFRREMVGPGVTKALSPQAMEAALGYIRANPAIWEVVVTGGDPLIASPRRLARLMAALRAIAHVKVVRFHTRVPVVAPARVTAALVAALQPATDAGGLVTEGPVTWVVLHANHAREFTPAARAAVARLVAAGIPMLSQSVLLRGINDDVETLGALMRAFVENRIKPYYLHQGDLAPGTGHFRTTIAEGQALMKGLRGRWSGLCQPHYVLDIPGGHGKVPVGPSWVTTHDDHLIVEDPRGNRHRYPPAGEQD